MRGLIALAFLANAPRLVAGQAMAPGEQPGFHPTASVEAVVQAIEACRERLDPQIDIGYERIASRCPDLARRLEHNELAAWLPEGWKDTGNNLSLGSLQELAVLVRREMATQASRRPPSVANLHGVLSEIGQATQRQNGFWTRIKLWMRKVFPSQDEPADSGWITRMIGRMGLSQTVIELVTYAALTVVIALGLLIVVNELRVAGFLRRTRGRGNGSSAHPLPTAQARTSWNDIEQAELRDRPHILLELLLDRLTQAQRLPPAHSLTTRELTRMAKLPRPEDAERLGALALTAERLRYSSAAAERAEIEAALAQGRALLNALEPAVAGQ